MIDADNADSGNTERTTESATPSDITVTGKNDAVVLPLKVNGVDLPDAVPGISSRYRLECGGIGTLSWAKPTKKPVEYIVERSIDNQATWITHTKSSGDFQKADIEVEPGVTNFFRVTAWTSDTKKSTGSVISIFRDAPLPAPILNRIYVSLTEDPTARPQIYFDWLWPNYDNPQIASIQHKYFSQTLSASNPNELEFLAKANNNWNLGPAARKADIGGWSSTLGNKEPYNPSNIDYHSPRFRKSVTVIGEGGVTQTRSTSIPYLTLTPSQAPAGKITAIRIAQVSETNGCAGVFSNYLTVVTPDKPICGQSILIGNADAGCCEPGDDYLGCKNKCPVRSLQDDTLEAQHVIKQMAKSTARSPILDTGAGTYDPREEMRYVFNDSYNLIHYDSLFPSFRFNVLDGNNIPVTATAEKEICGAFVCFKFVPTQTANYITGADIANVLYAEPILFLPKNHKFSISMPIPIKMAASFVLSATADLKYAKDPARGGGRCPPVPYKVTLKIVDKDGQNEQPLKFYKAPGLPRVLGQPVISNSTASKTLPGCFTSLKNFDPMFTPTGTSILLYEDAFPSPDYILGYDALGQPVAGVRATFEANVSDAPNTGPCGLWLKCFGFALIGDCKGAFAEVDGTIETPQWTGLVIQPDPFPELGPRYLVVEYKPQGASNVTGYEGDGITWDKNNPSVPRRGPILVAPNSPGDIGALAIWVGNTVVRRMGNADGTELRVVIPITTQTGRIALNYVDLYGLYGDNAGKWHFEVTFGRDCLRLPLPNPLFSTPPPQPPT